MPRNGTGGAASCTEDTRDETALELHPSLSALLRHLGLGADRAPDEPTWRELLGHLSERYRDFDRAHVEVAELKLGASSFESLFRTTPVAMMEQDCSRLLTWMEGLKRRGVTDIREFIGGDIEAIREIVPMIDIVRANPAAVKAVGIPIDELIGPVDPQIVNPGSEASWLTQFDAVWSGEPFAQTAFVAATADGKQFDAESLLSAPIVDGEPDFRRAVFSLIDITPHRDEERRMAGLVEEKNRFLATVSHEVRTPLTALLGFARILDDEEDGLPAEDRRVMTASIAEQAQEVSNLMEDLLVAARADAGQLEIGREQIDVAAQVAATMSAGGSYTAGVEVRIEAADARAMGDPARLRQIIRNLLTNAERYGGEQVTVTVSRDRDGLHVDVADDGDALADEHWERIFQPYETAHLDDRQEASVGIGLAISRELAEMMGGSLQYTHDGELSVFRLTLRPGS